MERYNRVAIALHWLIAGFIIALVPVGLLMEDLPKAIQPLVFQMHKTFGLMVLFLSLARIGWRVMNPPPPLPATMKPFEKLAAHGLHLIFYVLIIAIPLSGWMMVSASPKNIPTMFLTLFQWPHIWFLAQMAVEQKKAIIGDLHEVHELLAFGTIGLMVLHIAAGLKHQYMDKDNEMARMMPRLGGTTAPTRQPRGAGLVFGGTAALFVAIALISVFSGSSAPAQTPTTEDATEHSGNWAIDPEQSTLTFTFTHADNTIEGSFARWNADIQFDPDDLHDASVTARIDLGSAHTGDATYDAAMPEADWFDLASTREAIFESQSITMVSTGAYLMQGKLRLHGVSLPVSMPFSLKIDGDAAHAEGTATLDRLAYMIGANADPGAEYVSRMVTVTLSLNAVRRADT
jgi:cytochrome b561